MRDLELLQRRDEIWKELFQNAARVRKATRSNGWLRPISRKYNNTCREILLQKQNEVAHFATLCDYCDTAGDAHDMKLLREELEYIHSIIKSFEELHSDPDSDSDSDSDSDLDPSSDEYDSVLGDNAEAEDDANDADEADEADDDADSISISSSSSSASASASSSSSSSSSLQDMEDFY